MSKKQIPIEKLIVWAYEEILKQPDHGITSWEKLIYLGTVVDECEAEGRMPIGAGEPHPDAALVELKIRKKFELNPMRMQWARWRDILAPDIGACVSEDDPSVTKMVANCYQLVRTHGILGPKMGPHPVWDLGQPRLVRMTGPNGKPIVRGITAGRRYADGAHCPMELVEPSAPDIIAARFHYVAWWSSLVELSRESWNLVDHRPMPPLAPPTPWLTGAERKPRVLPTIASSPKVFHMRERVNL